MRQATITFTEQENGDIEIETTNTGFGNMELLELLEDFKYSICLPRQADNRKFRVRRRKQF